MDEPDGPLDPGAAVGMLRGAQDRSFSSEGIPMLLVLAGPGDEEPVVRDERAVAEGRAHAEGLDRVRAALFPTRRDGDMGTVISTVQAYALGAFAPREPR